MIAENELRIGNYFIDPMGELDVVFDLCQNGFGNYVVNGYLTINIKPIPLTEKWLLNFGFKDKIYTWDLKAKTKKITVQWGMRICSTGERTSLRVKKYTHIKSVHQLQNLYFALTGEELIRG